MSRAYYSDVLAAPVETVWAVLGRFDRISAWIKKLESDEIEGDAGVVVGSVRRLTLADGTVVRERLVAQDAVDRSYRYEFPAGDVPFPVRSYLATIRVRPITATGQTFLEWYGDFDAEEAVEEEMRETFLSRYIAFTGNLREHLGI